MTDGIIIAVIITVVFSAIITVVKAKLKGKKCMGCPDGCSCCNKETKKNK